MTFEEIEKIRLASKARVDKAEASVIRQGYKRSLLEGPRFRQATRNGAKDWAKHARRRWAMAKGQPVD